MTYTVKLDFWLDSDEVYSNEEIEEQLSDMLDGTAWGASNIKVLEVND
ncbi:hypothetical protein K413DRAFT_4786 [Clostridium sp. ASBs410]|jgi:hypothetical protein|nr:hypothetical protein K413DRAFT_4786 [Clostridium sp. ASBs410]